MKLSRLYQPKNPKFWIVIALNALSTAISFILQTQTLSTAVTLILAFFALANCVLGMMIGWMMVRDEP